MKEGAIDCERAIVTHHQATEVAEPGVSACDDPTPLVTSQGATILRRRFLPVRAMRDNQFDASSCQPLTQRITVVGLVGDHPHGLLSRPTRTMTPTYADRRKRGFREPDFRRGGRVKVVSQRKTAAVDHHHPLRALAPLGFSDSSAPFLAGAKLPSKKDSHHCNCCRSLSSARNARQTFSQRPCSSQSRSRRQQVEGCGYSAGKSCQRAPLRRIHRIPSRTPRLSIHGRPPRRFLRGFGSKGAIFFHCDSVSNGPDRAIGPPSALLTLLIAHSGKLNHHSFKPLSWVMQQLLERLEAPDKAGGPGFLRGEVGTPDGENLGALVDAFETFLGLGNRLNRRNPKLFRKWRVQGDAHPLPAILHAKNRPGQLSAEAQIYLAGGRFEEAVGLRRGKKIDDRLNSYGDRLLERLLELHVDLASHFTTIRRRTEGVLLDEQQFWRRSFRLAMQSHRV